MTLHNIVSMTGDSKSNIDGVLLRTTNFPLKYDCFIHIYFNELQHV